MAINMDSKPRDNTSHVDLSSQKTASEVRGKIKDYSDQKHLQNKFQKLFSMLCKEASGFSNELKLEYHIVVFNRKLNTRFTILESKKLISSKKNDDNKMNSFGVVGKLLNSDIESDFLMVQFGYAGIEPVVYVNKAYNDCSEPSICTLDEVELSNFWDDTEKKQHYWAVSGKPVFTIFESDGTTSHPETIRLEKGIEERKYAIAAMMFYNNIHKSESESIPIGVISLDFITKTKKYPNFAFREKEIEAIYQILQNIKGVIEIMITGSVSSELIEVINLALEDD